MSMEHVVDELSAYFDGEASAPESIASHLKSCPECAHRYGELKKLSEQLRTLRAPDVSPAFLTRVMAQIREKAPQEKWLRSRFAVPLALAAVLALVLIGGIFYVRSTPPPKLPSPVITVRQPTVPKDEITKDKIAKGEIAKAEFETAWGRGEDAGLYEAEYSLGVEPEPSLDEMVVGLANTDWFGVLASNWETEDDVDTMLRALDDEETAILEHLLRVYAKEGQTI